MQQQCMYRTAAGVRCCLPLNHHGAHDTLSTVGLDTSSMHPGQHELFDPLQPWETEWAVQSGRPLVGDEKPYRWRLQQLEKAGFRPGQAETLAVFADVDIHMACELVRSVLASGRQPEVAFDILS